MNSFYAMSLGCYMMAAAFTIKDKNVMAAMWLVAASSFAMLGAFK